MVLGVALTAASPSGSSGGGGESGEGAGMADGPGGGGDPPTAPDDLSFLCERDYAEEEINLDADARERVQSRVERFVLTTYGDPGTDPDAYERSVEGLVLGECYWGSPASGYVNGMGEVARSGGKANSPSGVSGAPTFAREFSHFEIDHAVQGEDYESGVGYTKAVGTAVWVSEESNGDARGWQQDVTLGKSGATGGDWKVLSGQTIPPTVEPVYRHHLPSGIGWS